MFKSSGVELKKTYDLDSLAPETIERSVRLAVAVDALVNQHDAVGGAINCHGVCAMRNEAIGVTACYGVGLQNELGRPFSCTGDLPTALAMLLLKKLTGVSMYCEVQVMDEKRKAVVLTNAGEGEDAIRRKGARPAIRASYFKGIHGSGAAFSYPLQNGPATIASLTPTPHGPKPFRLIAAEGEILEDTLPEISTLGGFFRFRHKPMEEAYTRWIEAGAVHHAAAASGHWGAELADIASLLKWAYIEV